MASFRYTSSDGSSLGTASDAILTAWVKLPVEIGKDAANGNNSLGHQVVQVSASSSATGATPATLSFALIGPGDTAGTQLLKKANATVTVTATRANLTNAASGNYVCTVAFADNTDKIDLAGLARDSLSPGAGKDTAWYMGVPTTDNAMGSLGSLTVRVCLLRAI